MIDIKELVIQCGTCKFWGTKEENDQNFTFRSCLGVKHDEDGLTHQYKQEKSYFDPNDPYDVEEKQKIEKFYGENRAVVLDGSGYFAALKTKEDFGCVLHSPAEETLC